MSVMTLGIDKELNAMTAHYRTTIAITIIFLTGCSNMAFDSRAEEEAKAIRLKNATYECCNSTAYESGYYYNGYQENGWRYCIIQK